MGRLRFSVNNAGIKKDMALMKMDAASWRDVIDTNLNGTFNYSRAVIGGMLRTGGAIVNVTSVSGSDWDEPGRRTEVRRRPGVIGLTRALAKEVARFGVRVNAVAPGFIETDMTSAIDENTRKKLYAQIPSGLAGTAQDVTKLVYYLAGDDAKYVTGQVWNIDGGLT